MSVVLSGETKDRCRNECGQQDVKDWSSPLLTEKRTQEARRVWDEEEARLQGNVCVVIVVVVVVVVRTCVLHTSVCPVARTHAD